MAHVQKYHFHQPNKIVGSIDPLNISVCRNVLKCTAKIIKYQAKLFCTGSTKRQDFYGCSDEVCSAQKVLLLVMHLVLYA